MRRWGGGGRVLEDRDGEGRSGAEDGVPGGIDAGAVIPVVMAWMVALAWQLTDVCNSTLSRTLRVVYF